MCKLLCSQEGGTENAQVTFLQEREQGVSRVAWSPFRN